MCICLWKWNLQWFCVHPDLSLSLTLTTLPQSNAKLKLVRSLAICEEPSPPPITSELPPEHQVNLSQGYGKVSRTYRLISPSARSSFFFLNLHLSWNVHVRCMLLVEIRHSLWDVASFFFHSVCLEMFVIIHNSSRTLFKRFLHSYLHSIH